MRISLNRIMIGLIYFVSIFVLLTAKNTVRAEDFSKIPTKGVITMVDLGAKRCIPCRMMVPVMEKIEKLYQGKAAIVFIDVWINREQGHRFGIQAIPTQIFFDQDAKEVYRHVGFMSEKEIKDQLTKMGVDKPS